MCNNNESVEELNGMEAFVQSWDKAEPWATPSVSSISAQRIAVIVEPRRHAFLRPVIRNHQAMLASLGFQFRLYTSESNVHWANEVINDHCTESDAHMRVDVRPLAFTNLNQILYSKLLMSYSFWEDLAPAEWVLVFQTDCVMFRPLTVDWLKSEWDYIGANYYNAAEVAPLSGGIQGGFSLRRRSAMLECLERVTWEDIAIYRNRFGLPAISAAREFEDIYFTHAVEMIGLRSPSILERSKFSIEAEYNPQTIAFHGWNKRYFTDFQVAEILHNARKPL